MDLCSTTGRGMTCSHASHTRQRSLLPFGRSRLTTIGPATPLVQRHLTVTSAAASVPAPSNRDDGGLIQRIASFPDAFWKFLRPHTIRGTILGTTAVTAKVLLENPQCIDWSLLPRALLGLVALLCGNGYIVGINQIYDVDIDVLNKPFLPIASGELSPAMAWFLCLALAAAGVSVVATNFGSVITYLYTFGLFLGTVYSVPPLRLKQYAVPAFLIIAIVRGFLLNFGVYSAARAALQLPFEWSPAISFITVFVTVFATVIAITKDLPDVEGDRANNISTFATRLGVRNVALLAIGLLFANYLGAVGLALTCSNAFNVPLMAGAHALLGCVLLLRTLKLHASNYSREAVGSFYRWIWNLFYAEYALLPFL